MAAHGLAFVTGDEAGASRTLTGDQYLGSDPLPEGRPPRRRRTRLEPLGRPAVAGRLDHDLAPAHGDGLPGPALQGPRPLPQQLIPVSWVATEPITELVGPPAQAPDLRTARYDP